MAVKKQVQQISIKCDSCGKEILPTVAAIPTDYVWKDGKNVCKECVAKGM